MGKRRRWGKTHDELKRRLSKAAFAELVRLFGGTVIRVPKKIRESRIERSARVVALLDDGHTYRSAAEAADLPLRSTLRAAKLVE